MKRVGIIGASGYTGHVLLKLLTNHPGVDVAVLNSRSFKGKKVSSLYSDFTGDEVYSGYSLDEINDMSLDLIFVALPHGQSMNTIAQLKGPAKLIDLSADYRFDDSAVYEKVYGEKLRHSSHDWVYGLPELFRDEIKSAQAVSNPGCFAAASILAVYPAQDLARHIVTDCKSGWSGAGRNSAYAKDPTLIKDNLIAYNLTRHRHKYEIAQFIKTKFSFTPHVFGTFEGMMCTAHLLLDKAIEPEEIIKRYQNFYKDTPFTRVVDGIPDVHATQATNYCHIGGFEIDEANQLVIVSTIDNLWKGASGQAVQNMNLMLGFPETDGLTLT